MGYDTRFKGHVSVDPPLNADEVSYLRRFARSRRYRRDAVADPYRTDEPGGMLTVGQLTRDAGGDYNAVPDGQPGLWCQWLPTPDGETIRWDEGEKFYDAAEWMAYLIDHFLKPDGQAKGHPGFEAFTFDHVVNGRIEAQGDDDDDYWALVVTDNAVAVES